MLDGLSFYSQFAPNVVIQGPIVALQNNGAVFAFTQNIEAIVRNLPVMAFSD